MARREKMDHSLNGRLDEFEQKLFMLKIEYEKHFSGIEPVEPVKGREDLRRVLRVLMRERINNTGQKFRLRQLKARFASMELYWQRNLVQIERGTHPKQRFRADLHDRDRGIAPGAPPPPRQRPPTAQEREDQAYKAVYDKYIETRKTCGQNTELSYESIREVLKTQVGTIKSRFHCTSVKFRVTVEDGKAKVKAVPVR